MAIGARAWMYACSFIVTCLRMENNIHRFVKSNIVLFVAIDEVNLYNFYVLTPFPELFPTAGKLVKVSAFELAF